MPNDRHPGVYIQEVPRARGIRGASTSVAAFVGTAATGPIDTPTLITGWSDFTRQFGALFWYSFMPWAVYEFFSEGGAACWIVRTDTSSGQAATASLGGLTLKAATPGPWGNSLGAIIRNAGTGPQDRQSPAFALDVVVEAEAIGGSQGRPGDMSRASLGTRLLNAYVRQNGLTVQGSAARNWYVLESFSGLTDTGNGFIQRINSSSMFIRVAQADGTRPANTPSPTAFSGGTAITYDLDGSVDTLATVKEPSLLAVPDSVALTDADDLPSPADQRAFANRILARCQQQTNLFYVVDPPYGQNISGIVDFKTGGGKPLQSSYGALYYPWVWIANPLTGTRVPVPPSGPALGRYAYTDANTGVFKAPAGVNDGALRTVVAADAEVTDADQDILTPNGINPVRNLIHYGHVLWGARTLSRDGQWIYINVRRLFIYVEQSLRDSLQWVAFETNDQQLWSAVTRDITAFLTTLWQQGALFGTTASEAFFVTCDASNNPQETRRLGQLTIDIGLAAVYPGEFATLRITLNTAG